MDPTADVDETPVKPITSAGDIEPTADVVDCPASASERLVVGDNAPIADVVESPVKPTLASIVKVRLPKLEVVLRPVKETSVGPCSPHWFEPQVVPDWFQVLDIRF